MFSAASCPSLKIVYNLRERTYYLTLDGNAVIKQNFVYGDIY